MGSMPRRFISGVVMTMQASASLMRSLTASARKPPNSGAKIAPSLAIEMALAYSSGILGR